MPNALEEQEQEPLSPDQIVRAVRTLAHQDGVVDNRRGVPRR
jgi:hypothetical protein